MKIFVRKLLYALACLLLIELCTVGFYGETRMSIAMGLMFIMLVMMPRNWERDWFKKKPREEEPTEKAEE